jgi:hypothetical protein
MNETQIEITGVTEMLKVIEQLGGWSLIEAKQRVVDNSTVFQKILALRKLDMNPLFIAYVSANPKTPDVYVLRVY